MKKSISQTAQERKDKLTGKGQDAKSIENRVHYESMNDEGFTRGGGKAPATKPKTKK